MTITKIFYKIIRKKMYNIISDATDENRTKRNNNIQIPITVMNL